MRGKFSEAYPEWLGLIAASTDRSERYDIRLLCMELSVLAVLSLEQTLPTQFLVSTRLFDPWCGYD